jgi:hypothetical protein
MKTISAETRSTDLILWSLKKYPSRDTIPLIVQERNMLLTMEQAYKESYQAMPNPERIDKVIKFCLSTFI